MSTFNARLDINIPLIVVLKVLIYIIPDKVIKLNPKTKEQTETGGG